ncbi:MAG: ketoacyl-ACP synthase III, partial [Saprospiraceae bacterium]
MSAIYSIITGTGSYIPKNKVRNEDFLDNEFYDKDGTFIEKPNAEVIEKFKSITTISERRYAEDNVLTSDMAYLAAKDALESSGTDAETLDYIIMAH